jgi:hypothetical protein
MILIELTHLPSNDYVKYVKIKEFFQLMFRGGNHIYSWGDMKKELKPTKRYQLFDWPILASMIDIQLYFPGWYEWALSHCEACSPKHQSGVNVAGGVNISNYSSFRCKCHERSPYHQNEKWLLQKALMYAAHMFIDKAQRMNNWSAGLSSETSTLSTSRRTNMMHYAIHDCFATTYLIRPILEEWSFQRVKNINVIELFRAFKPTTPLPLPQAKKKKKKNIDAHEFMRIYNGNDLEPISDDEIYLSQLIIPTNEQSDPEEKLNEQQQLNDKQDDKISIHAPVSRCEFGSAEIIRPDPEPIADAEPGIGGNLEPVDADIIETTEQIQEEPVQHLQQSTHRRRSARARNGRNRKRNQQRRKYRYCHAIRRRADYRFKSHQMRKILRLYGIHFVHVKKDNGDLLIGLKDDGSKEEAERTLAMDIFSSRSYYYYRRRW